MENDYIHDDWEKEGDKDSIYLLERMMEIEEEFLPPRFGSVEIDYSQINKQIKQNG